MTKKEFCEQVNTYRYQLYVAAYTILKNEADAQDAVCSAVLKAWEHLEQLREPRRFKAWLITITKNEAFQLKQKRMDLPGNEQIEMLLEPTHDSYNELWDVVQGLKEEFRLVIVLFYYDDLSIREIARVLNVPAGTVKSRLNRGREMLKTLLNGQGGEV